MIVDNLLGHSSETSKIEAFYDALKLIGDMDINPFQAGYCDDISDVDREREDEMSDADEWMDEWMEGLAEAA